MQFEGKLVLEREQTADWKLASERTRPHTRLARYALAIVFAVGIVLGAACGGDDSESGAADTTTNQTAATAAPSESSTESEATAAPSETPAAPAETPATTAATLSANDASIAELTAAFEAAGISNARRWAREVDEYRPYETDDTEYKKLRGELAKYNPAPGVVDAIIALLHLP